MMSKFEVFEPAKSRATGSYGVGMDPILVQFCADLLWLADQGIEVVRHNLGHDAAAFGANPEVIREMHMSMDRLPISTLDGRIISMGVYPSRAQLIQKLGLKAPTDE
jgi:hypothetical protein